MNPIRISAAVLFLVFATFACAQKQREEPLPKQEEAKPSKETKEAKPSKAEKQETAKPSKAEKQDMKQDTKKPAHEGAGQQAQERHGRPAGKSAHIPDAKFRASFGRQHTFVVKQPVVVEGQSRVQYSGYWFEIIAPWPVGWAYTDDCYIDFVDGDHFLFDVLIPA